MSDIIIIGKCKGFIKTTKQELSSSQTQDRDLPLFDFEEIDKATNNFSWGNKLGQGGFGFVYKVIILILIMITTSFYYFLNFFWHLE